MNNFVVNGVKVSEEQYKRIMSIRDLSDDEIDFSDIPETTPEEWARVKQRRLQKEKLKIAS